MLFNNREVDFQGIFRILLYIYGYRKSYIALIVVKEGDRIAKLVIERYYTPNVIEVEDLKVNS